MNEPDIIIERKECSNAIDHLKEERERDLRDVLRTLAPGLTTPSEPPLIVEKPARTPLTRQQEITQRAQVQIDAKPIIQRERMAPQTRQEVQLCRTQQRTQHTQQQRKQPVPVQQTLVVPVKQNPIQGPPTDNNNSSATISLDMVKAAIFRRLAGGKCAFTSAGRNDGVGAQALAKITVMVMAKALGMPYVHQPFQVLEHTDNGMKSAVYAERWEKLLSLRGTALTLDRYPHTKHVDCTNLPRTLAVQQLVDGWCFALRDAHSFTNYFSDQLDKEWASVIAELRVRYVGPRTGDANDRTVHVAVHIRRGDALQRGGVVAAQRVLSNDYYANIMSKLSTDYAQSDQKCKFHIVSEGQASDFADLSAVFGSTIEFHLSEPSTDIHHASGQSNKGLHPSLQPRNHRLLGRSIPDARSSARGAIAAFTTEDAFKLLVGADVLVMSKSAFSYLAAIYSKGIKIVPPDMWITTPAWCKKHDNWIVSEKVVIP